MTELIERLEALVAGAPPRIAPGVLLETGIADGLITVDGPVGPLQVAFNQRGVSATSLLPETGQFTQHFAKRFGRPLVAVEAAPKQLQSAIVKSVETNRLGTLPVDLRASTEFQQTVLRLVAGIPPGEVRPYSWVAREAGRPGAARAVGSTMATNPIPVLIPCHRVVKSDGAIGNYLFGPETKVALLEHEGMNVEDHVSATTAGYRLTGSATTKITCYPTCRHARRTTDKHRQWFRDLKEARAAGYRPCKVCRPATGSG